jgi:hypothetical protein
MSKQGKRKKRKSRRVLVVLMSDMHSGHRLGLMAPGTQLVDDDGNTHTPQLTKVQEYLWDLYSTYVDEVTALAAGDEIIIIHNGDATQGNRYPARWVSERESDHVAIAVQALAPWCETAGVRTMRILVGTGAHNFGRASAEVELATQLQALYPKANVKCLYHGIGRGRAGHAATGAIPEGERQVPVPRPFRHRRGDDRRSAPRGVSRLALVAVGQRATLLPA